MSRTNDTPSVSSQAAQAKCTYAVRSRGDMGPGAIRSRLVGGRGRECLRLLEQADELDARRTRLFELPGEACHMSR